MFGVFPLVQVLYRSLAANQTKDLKGLETWRSAFLVSLSFTQAMREGDESNDQTAILHDSALHICWVRLLSC